MAEEYIDEEEGSGLGLGALAGAGSIAASIIFRKPIGKFVKQYADDFASVTRPRDPDARQITYTRPEERISKSKELVTTDTPVDPQDVQTQSIASQILKTNKEYKAKMAKAEIEKPFSLGGTSEQGDLPGGSTLFHHLAVKYPDVKPQPVSFWVDYFTSKSPKEISYLADGIKQKARVTLEELRDTNIAQFSKEQTIGVKKYTKKIFDPTDTTSPVITKKIIDPQGIERIKKYNKIVEKQKPITGKKLTGGYLKYIEDINKLTGTKDGEILVDPVTLMELIQKAPGNNLSVIKYSSSIVKYYNKIFHDSQGHLLDDILRSDPDIGQKLTSKRLVQLFANATEPSDKVRYEYLNFLHRAHQISKGIGKHQEMIGPYYGGADEATKKMSWQNLTHHENFNDFVKQAKKELSKPENKSIKNDKILEHIETYNPEMSSNVLKSANELHGNFFSRSPSKYTFDRQDRNFSEENMRTGKKGKNVSSVMEYPLERVYRTLGGEQYDEDVITITDKGLSTLPGAMKIGPEHFHQAPDGSPLDAQVVHVRYHTRFVDSTDLKTTPSTNAPKEKIMLIDEAQSDKQQGVEKFFNKKRKELAYDRYQAEENAKRAERGRPNIRPEEIDQRLAAMGPSQYEELYTKPSKKFGDRFLFKKDELRQNMFNLNTITSATYNDRLLTIANEMRKNVNKGSSRTEEDYKKLKELQESFNTLRQLIPSQSTRRSMSQADYLPMQKKEVWGPLAVKQVIREAAKDGVQWVGIVPYEVGHHTRPSAQLLGNLEFYGNAYGRGDLRTGVSSFKELKSNTFQPGATEGRTNIGRKASAQGATLPSFLKRFAEEHGTEVKTIKVYKSNPTDEVKFIANKQQKSIDPLTGKETDFQEHVGSMTLEEYENLGPAALKNLPFNGGRFGGTRQNLKDDAMVQIRKKTGDVVQHIDTKKESDFFLVYALKVKPSFKEMPMKSYKEGGLAVNVFKW